MRRSFFVLMIVVWCAPLHGQPRRMMEREPGQHRFLFVEALVMPSSDSTLSRVDVHYRVDKKFFVPVKNDGLPWKFTRRGDIIIELLDESDISAARDITHAEIGSNTAESEEVEWHQGAATFNVRPGKYRLSFEIDDLESDRRYLDRNRPVIVRRFSPDSLALGDAVMIAGTVSPNSGQTALLQNFGGDIRFGHACTVLFPVRMTSDPIRVHYTISEISRPDEPGRPVVEDSNLVTLAGVTLVPDTAGGDLAYSIASSRNPNDGVLAISIPARRLALRHFMLKATFTDAQGGHPVADHFQTVWPDMPLSLRDVEFALNALRYITTEQQLDSLKDGSFETQRDNLEKFWARRNPDTLSAMNPVMTQYYRRVDYAVKNFGTLRDPDGSKTDRGRIYILHGAPARIQRSLDPDRGFKEIWTYTNPEREFVFVDESKSGNYTLVTRKTL